MIISTDEPWAAALAPLLEASAGKVTPRELYLHVGIEGQTPDIEEHHRLRRVTAALGWRVTQVATPEGPYLSRLIYVRTGGSPCPTPATAVC